MADKAKQKRIAQNAGVKAGTIRTGAKGKSVRKYNATTGRWDVVQKKTSGTGYGNTTPNYLTGTGSRGKAAPPAKTGNKRTTSGTVSSAIAAGRAQGPGKKTPPRRTQVAIPLPYYQPKVDVTGVRSAVEKGVTGFVRGGMSEVSRNKNKKPKSRTKINIPLPVYSPTVDITGAKSTAENFFRGAFKGMRGK